MTLAIRVKHLTKTYKLYEKHIDRLKETFNPFNKKYHQDFNALDNVSFEIKKGEVVGIIGRNGSGKSTLLKIITNVLHPSGGNVSVKGKISAILELGAGFNPELTGLENIYLNTAINGLSRSKTNSIINEIIDFSELGDFIHQPVKTYSSGMKAKLAFGVSISIEPDVLIIDEALSVGDAAFQRKSFSKIENFRKRGKTIFFVSHSPAQIIELCDRAIWLHRGIKILDGDSKIVTGLYQKHGLGTELSLQEVEQEFSEQVSNKRLATVQKNTLPTSKAFYNPDLKPTSCIKCMEKGAQIHNAKVLNKSGEEANVLVKNEYYSFGYDIKFDIDLEEVNLGMVIKTVTGLSIGGSMLPSAKDKVLQNIKKGSTYHIEWEFKNILNCGTYFFNCGANALVNGKRVVLHRIIDAYMIEVLLDKNDTAKHSIDFGFNISARLIE